MADKVKVKSLKITCDSLPLQLEGMTDNGKHIYIRLRFGLLTVGIADSIDGAVRNSAINVKKDFHKFLGSMSLHELIKNLDDFLDFESCEFMPREIKFFIFHGKCMRKDNDYIELDEQLIKAIQDGNYANLDGRRQKGKKVEGDPDIEVTADRAHMLEWEKMTEIGDLSNLQKELKKLGY